MSAFKLITFLFPFLREMVLGNKTIREAVKTNKTRVLMLLLTCLVFFGFIFETPKLIKISAEYVILEKKYDEMSKECQAIHCDAPSGAAAAGASEVKAKEPVKKAPVEHRQLHADTDQTSSDWMPTPTPDPVPTNAPQTPVLDQPPTTPKEPVKQHPARSRPHDKPDAAVAAMNEQEKERYQAWRQTFDQIQAMESHDAWAHNNPNYERH